MRFGILPAICVAFLLASPAGAQSDQAAVDALVGKLRPRPSAAPLSPDRGIPSLRPAAVQPTASQPVSATAPVTAPRPTTQAAMPAPAATADRPSADLNILFATGSAELTPSAVRDLQILGRALTDPSMGESRFLIEGHTDTVGDRAMNQALSERRAAAVAAFLMREFGLPASRLTTVGKGEDSLLVPTPDNVPEPRNRRVHIVNLDG